MNRAPSPVSVRATNAKRILIVENIIAMMKNAKVAAIIMKVINVTQTVIVQIIATILLIVQNTSVLIMGNDKK